MVHKVTLNKELWDREYYSHIIEKAMRSFICSEWDQIAVIIDFKSKEFYCNDHQSLMDSCSDDLNKIEDILNKFKKKLTKIEKMLILIQERELFFNTNDKKKRITKKEKEEIQLKNII